MVQALIVTLREGVEAALVIGIAVAYLAKSGRGHLVRVVYFALAAAILASFAGAAMLQRVTLNQEAVEGYLLLLAAFFVATVVFWMQRTARSLRRRIEQRLENISSQQKASALGVFLFVFFMVFREGMETVLILSAVSWNSADLLTLLGTATGLALAVVFGIVFVRGTVRMDLRKFFRVTSIILGCVVLQLLVTGLHELSEAQVLPSSQREMALVGPIVSNSVFFFVVILALAALMVLFDWRSRQLDPSPAGTASRAEQRKQLWGARKERFWAVAVCLSAFVFVVLITAEFIYAKSATALSPAQPVAAEQGVILIPAESVSDGNLHRFIYTAGDVTARFIVVRVGTRFATALDACDICGPQGYYQKGTTIICRNCSAEIYGPTIGLTGGCNPAPLPSAVEGAMLRIEAADLESGARYFHAHQ